MKFKFKMYIINILFSTETNKLKLNKYMTIIFIKTKQKL